MAAADPSLPMRRVTALLRLASAASALAVAGCGGGDGDGGNVEAASAQAATAADVEVQPSFHRQPFALAEPDDEDADGSAASVARAPAAVEVPQDWQGLDTLRLTDERVQAWRDASPSTRALSAVKPAATTASSVVYTPAQIRAAYGLPTVPSSIASLSTAAAAALGAGQTIFVIDAYHHPNAIADLAAFNTKFGLPGCTTVTVATGATTLAVASASAGCQVAQVYAASGAKTGGTAPAYNAGWAQEIALDMQWAHAIAPLARIVLIEAADATTSGLTNAITLANKLGPGVVTMSFGASEGSWVTNTASLFQTSGMSYLAATGDSGSAVSWPSAMPTVLAVGGTTLRYSTSSRTETTWAKTGGGISAYVKMPSYQTALTIAGEPTASGATKYRSVGDLAFNADPATGQWVAFMAKGASAPSWYAFGGTSISAPQWAGLTAAANAQRALSGRAVLGAFHSTLYGSFAPSTSSYASAFYDITSGSNGTCKACYAGTGYDTPTGLGTPRASALLAALAVQ